MLQVIYRGDQTGKGEAKKKKKAGDKVTCWNGQLN